ncbi:BnaA01g13170D [Brassica napus]|uniref:BnaA01g13170D protein n=1 Tax=Brassica napus TaxID=3708 RepID=A0A078I3G0_BRANA|nr:BnaA01g13170D [Brassica napus]
MTISSSLKRSCSSPDLRPSSKRTIPQSSGSPGVMLFPKDGGCVLYNPKEGTFQRKLGDFSGCRFLANSGNWLLLLDSGSNLYIVDAFSEKKIRLPQDSDSIFSDLSADVYVVVWLFDLPGHSYMSFCKNGDTHYTDIPLFHHQDLHWLDGLSEMVLWGTRLYLSTNRRYVRVLDLSGPQGFFKDITDGQVLLVESDPCNRTCFRLYKKNPDIENPDLFGHTVTEVDSLNGEALLLDLGYTVPANKALGIEPDSIYFTRHYRPCQCASPDLDICVFNLATKSLDRYPDLDKMDLIDARWFLPSGN